MQESASCWPPISHPPSLSQERQRLMVMARESRVHLAPALAKASMHRAIARSPELAALMGKEE
jgi:hypothetical protein